MCNSFTEGTKVLSIFRCSEIGKKSEGNHLFIQNNNKNCREMGLLSLSVRQILKFASKRLNFSDFKD
jgi:hypothetical protein